MVPQRVAQADALMGVETGEPLPVGRDATPVTWSTERASGRSDNAKRGSILKSKAGRWAGWVLPSETLDGPHAVLESFKDLGRVDNIAAVPAVGTANIHVLDKAQLSPLAGGKLKHGCELVVVEAAHHDHVEFNT